jgi:hypothetical protein
VQIVKSHNLYKNNELFFMPAVMAFILCSVMMIQGYPQGHDWLFELVRISQYHEALTTGQNLPFWANDLYQGFGSPVFLFYAPLYSACAALLMMTGMSVTTAAISILVIFSVIGAIGMAGLMREIIGQSDKKSVSASRIAAISYVLAPYFIANMLVRNASAEFTALCLAPFPFWGLAMLYRGNIKGLYMTAISFALVIMAHNLTALIVAGFLCLCIAVIYTIGKDRQQLLRSITAIIIALGLACWFWLPALTMKEHLRIGELLFGKLDFHNNFSSLPELLNYGGLFVLMIIAATMAIIKGNRERLLICLLASSLALIFMQLSASTILWENLPFLPLFQFPWRMMGPLAFVTALMAGLLFYQYMPNRKYTEALIIAFLIISAIPTINKYQYLSPENYIIAEHQTTPSEIRKNIWPITVGDEYLPISSNKNIIESFPHDNLLVSSKEPVKILDVKTIEAREISLDITSEDKIEINIPRWYFPGWMATINGKEYQVGKNNNGTITVELPKGSNKVRLWLEPPEPRRKGILISMISMLILAALPIIRRANRLE